MAGLCWIAVTLVWFLSAGNSLAVVDQNTLPGIVARVRAFTPRYNGRSPMFSVAVSVPYNEHRRMYDMSKVFADDRVESVKQMIQQCEVYRGKRVVAATLLKWPDVLNQCPRGPMQWLELQKNNRKPVTWADLGERCPMDGRADHAEYRTLQDFDTLVNNRNQNDLLLFYSSASPCDEKCTKEGGPESILNDIEKIKKWKDYAFVFSNIFKPRSGKEVPEANLRGAIEQLGNRIDLSKIFRCNRRGNAAEGNQPNPMVCTSCSNDGQVTKYCISDEEDESGGEVGAGGTQSGGGGGAVRGGPQSGGRGGAVRGGPQGGGRGGAVRGGTQSGGRGGAVRGGPQGGGRGGAVRGGPQGGGRGGAVRGGPRGGRRGGGRGGGPGWQGWGQV